MLLVNKANDHVHFGVGGLWSIRHFQQYFSYIVAVIVISEGNRSARRKPPTCRKPLTNIISKHLTFLHFNDFSSIPRALL